MSFYLKHRPSVFSELDNEHVRKTLASLLTKPKAQLPHAFMLTGSRGTGKTTTARLIAKMYNCTNPGQNGEPCGECPMCKAIAGGSSMDVLEIDAASNTGVDNIRELRQNIALAPSSAARKVYIIDEVHMLSTGAFNALLKTLEEPPAHAVFILATTDPQKVPETIQSRCLQLVFTKPSEGELIKALRRVMDREGITADDEALAELATYANGSFRDAVKILEQVSFHSGKITKSIVRETLRGTDTGVKETFLAALRTKDAKTALELVSGLVQSGTDLKTFMLECIAVLEGELIGAVTGTGSGNWTVADIRELLRRFNQAGSELRNASIPQLPLELVIIEHCFGMPSTLQPVPENRPHPVAPASGSAPPSSRTVPPPARKPASSAVPSKAAAPPADVPSESPSESLELITVDKLLEHWTDILNELKPYNHSVAGVFRSCKPLRIEGNTVVIETAYKFHRDKLSEPKTTGILTTVMKKLFGERPRIRIELREAV